MSIEATIVIEMVEELWGDDLNATAPDIVLTLNTEDELKLAKEAEKVVFNPDKAQPKFLYCIAQGLKPRIFAQSKSKN